MANLLSPFWFSSGGVEEPTVPDAPTNIVAVAGDETAAVTWDAPASDGGSTITGYTVTSSPGGLEAVVNGVTLAAVVEGLTNDTEYTFTVVATNAVGDSDPSAASNAVTPESDEPGVGDSEWYPTRLDDSAFNLADVPFAGYTETTRPTTTTTSSASSGGAVTSAASVAGRHVTVDAATACGDITISADDVRITFGAGCTVGTVFLTNCDRWHLEGAPEGTRVVSNAAFGAGCLLTTFEATASHGACTDMDFLSDGESDNNICILAMNTWTFVGCRFKSDTNIAVNFIGDSSNCLFANCNFITGTGADSRWNIRNTATGERNIVVLDCGFSNSASAYGCIRIGGTGWWLDGCHVNGGIEITLEGGHVAEDVYLTNNHIYRSTSFAGNGTMDNINITGNTFYATGWDADSDIASSLSDATNLTVSGNTFLENDATFSAWEDPPGNPASV